MVTRQTPFLRLLLTVTVLSLSRDVDSFVTTSPSHRHLHHQPRQRQSTSRIAVSTVDVSTPLSYEEATQMSSASESDEATAAAGMGVSMPLIRAIWFNQATILLGTTALVAAVSVASGFAINLGSLHWNGGGASFFSLLDWQTSPLRLAAGVLATIPLVALGNLIETSDHRDASYVNFSTTNMVITLFGRRKSTLDPQSTSSSLVMLLSAAIALSTGISEELVFRGYLPTALQALSHSIPIALMGSASLYALAHLSPDARAGENRVIGGMQLLHGLWYGLIYLVTGGDILPCIVAHMLYDMHVLCETWSVINKQMDYTQDAVVQRLDATEEQAISQIQEKAGPSLNDDTLSFARRFFYAFDSQHQGALSLSDVQRAVSYAFLQDADVPSPRRVRAVFEDVVSKHNKDDRPLPKLDRLNIPDFLMLLYTLKSTTATSS